MSEPNKVDPFFQSVENNIVVDGSANFKAMVAVAYRAAIHASAKPPENSSGAITVSGTDAIRMVLAYPDLCAALLTTRQRESLNEIARVLASGIQSKTAPSPQAQRLAYQIVNALQGSAPFQF